MRVVVIALLAAMVGAGTVHRVCVTVWYVALWNATACARDTMTSDPARRRRPQLFELACHLVLRQLGCHACAQLNSTAAYDESNVDSVSVCARASCSCDGEPFVAQRLPRQIDAQ